MLLQSGTMPFPTSAKSGPATAEQVGWLFSVPGDSGA
jgi:hypothetical protein